MNSSDVIVIGGGLVGTAVAYGLLREGARVTVLDGADDAYRASRGNFGLVWVQGKGYKFIPYARWTIESARAWPAFYDRLAGETGIDVQLRQPGGYVFFQSEQAIEQRRERLSSIRDDLSGDYPFEILGRAELRERVPQVGPAVLGASYTPMDGHANPLKLLLALHTACKLRGAKMLGSQQVRGMSREGAGFTVDTGTAVHRAPRVVLAAGLGNRDLAPLVGLCAPVRPQRGQLLVTERTSHFLDFPTHVIRQTDEGSIQIGDSLEEVGNDDGTTTEVLADIAKRAIRTFPVLAGLNLVRAWGALRVMSQDGYPIYQESATHPGAFIVTCHSGVTLAASHAMRIAPWIAGGPKPEGLEAFSDERFRNKQ